MEDTKNDHECLFAATLRDTHGYDMDGKGMVQDSNYTLETAAPFGSSADSEDSVYVSLDMSLCHSARCQGQLTGFTGKVSTNGNIGSVGSRKDVNGDSLQTKLSNVVDDKHCEEVSSKHIDEMVATREIDDNDSGEVVDVDAKQLDAATPHCDEEDDFSEQDSYDPEEDSFDYAADAEDDIDSEFESEAESEIESEDDIVSSNYSERSNAGDEEDSSGCSIESQAQVPAPKQAQDASKHKGKGRPRAKTKGRGRENPSYTDTEKQEETKESDERVSAKT